MLQVLQYARDKYTAFLVAIEDLGLEEEEKEGLEEMLAVKRTAYTLDNIIRVITSIIKKLGANPSVFALLEGIQSILDKLDALCKSIKALPTLIPRLVVARASSNRSSSRFGSYSRGRSRGRSKSRSNSRSSSRSRASPRKESSSLLVNLDT